jgi:hypothetical protein
MDAHLLVRAAGKSQGNFLWFRQVHESRIESKRCLRISRISLQELPLECKCADLYTVGASCDYRVQTASPITARESHVRPAIGASPKR